MDFRDSAVRPVPHRMPARRAHPYLTTATHAHRHHHTQPHINDCLVSRDAHLYALCHANERAYAGFAPGLGQHLVE